MKKSSKDTPVSGASAPAEESLGSALSTVSGPSTTLPDASGLETDIEARLAENHAAMQRAAAAMPFNPIKAAEYGADAARSPEAGRPPLAPQALDTASTITEEMESPKTGNGEPQVGFNPNNGPLDRVRADSTGRGLTTNQGVPVANNQDSLKAGLRGPSLLEDFILREKITHFDHERIPERVVHARGSAAHGFFECYEALTDLTMAAPFQEAGKRTPVFVRFSTVAGERGSADAVRDVRGFAVKFYTDAGNWDLVGNNIPVFFIQDAMKFPDLVHALKPEPHFGVPQASSAHDTFWDFVSLMPESTHMLMWAMSDRAIPRSYRMMQGFGVHTFRLVNAEGRSVFCKFHWTPKLGTHALTWDEAVKINGADPDYHRRDLWEAIEALTLPEWELGLQLFTEEDAEKFDFDILDATKIVPEELVPLKPVGRLVLTRNPDNFFAETEQVAFCAAHIIPGIDFTNDPLLQGRIHSYLDTQITRLGSVNFHEIPINAPVAEVHNNQRDGHHRMTINRGRVAYEPNSLAGGCPFQHGRAGGGFMSFPEPVTEDKVRGKPERFAEHYSQARLFWRSQTPIEQQHIAAAFRFELTRVQTQAIRERVVSQLANVAPELAAAVADGLGIPVPSPMPRVQDVVPEPVPAASAALSMFARPGDGSIRGRRIALLVADGIEATTLRAVHGLLAKAQAVPRFVGSRLGIVQPAGGGAPIHVEVSIEAAPSVLWDAVVVPNGDGSQLTMLELDQVLEFVKLQYRHCKPILALGAGGLLLDSAGVRRMLPDGSSDPGVVCWMPADEAVTSSAGEVERAVAAFVEALARHRHFEREMASLKTAEAPSPAGG